MSKRGRPLLGAVAAHPDTVQTRKQVRLNDARRASGAVVRIGSDSLALVFRFLTASESMQAVQTCHTWYHVLAHTTLRCFWSIDLPSRLWHAIPRHFARHVGELAPQKDVIPILGPRAITALAHMSQLHCLCVRIPQWTPKGTILTGTPSPPLALVTLELGIEPQFGIKISDNYISKALAALAPRTLRRLIVGSANHPVNRVFAPFSGLRFYPHLTFLDLSDCVVSFDGFTTIRTYLVALEELRLEPHLSVRYLNELCAGPNVLTHLTRIHFRAKALIDTEIQCLARFPSLKHVYTNTAWRVSALKTCHLLPSVTDVWICHGFDEEVKDVSFLKTCDLRHVESLTLFDVACHTSSDTMRSNQQRVDLIEVLLHMPRLRTLRLSACGTPDLSQLEHPVLQTVNSRDVMGRVYETGYVSTACEDSVVTHAS